MEVVKEFLKWVSDGQPLITRCQNTHPELFKFCKAKKIAVLESIAKEIHSTYSKELK
jgi:hypothetical protein